VKRLKESVKWLYGSGDLSFSLANTSIGAFFAIFLTDTVGIQAGYASLFIIIGGVWDALTDPVMGALSDRSRLKLGRRRPFILFGALPYAFLYVLIWWQPSWLTPQTSLFYYPLILVLFQSASTLVNMPYLALTPELTADYDERNVLTSRRMIFSILGSLLVFSLPMMVIGEFVPENVSAIRWVGIVTAALCFLPFFLIGLFIRETQVDHRRDNPQERAGKFPGLGESFRLISSNRAFGWALLLFLFSWLAVEVVQATLLYFIKYRLDMADQSALIMGAVFVAALISLPGWEVVSARTDKRKGFIIGTSFWLAMQLLLVLFTPNTPLILILIIGGFAGIGVGAMHVFSWSMIPDSIDVGDAKGRNQEGLYYSIVGFMRKIASKLTVGMVLFLLELSGYEANAVQSGSSSWALSLLFGPLPALFLIIAIAAAVRYPVRRESIGSGS
jgi:GPH family glycoside/pentoside/hexuronide:cation symporter